MNTLSPDVLQFPNLKATHPPEAILVLVEVLLAVTRIVNQESDIDTEKPILGNIEYSYPKGPGGPLTCFFNSVKYPLRFGGGFRRKTDTGPWYKSHLLSGHDNDPHPVNVTPAFYENALNLVFDKNVRENPLPGYANPSVNKFYFHVKANPNIQYIFTASLESSNLKEHFPKNFQEVDVINSELAR